MAVKDLLKNIRLLSTVTLEKTEFESGVMIERRSFLWLPLVAVGAFLPATKAFANDNLVENALTWEGFIKECVPTAIELHKNTTAEGQDAYLFWLASMAARLSLDTIPKAKLGKFADLDPSVEFGVGYKGVPFFVVEWKMAPNAILPPHCHPNASVCTVGIEGEARICNFEIVGNAPEFTSTEKFKVRETHNEIVSRGRINALSAKRDNIHTFKVGKNGAHGIDISTYHGENIGFSFLDIQSKPMDEENHLFEANWMKL